MTLDTTRTVGTTFLMKQGAYNSNVEQSSSRMASIIRDPDEGNGSNGHDSSIERNEERNSEPSLAEVLLHLADPCSLGNVEAHSQPRESTTKKELRLVAKTDNKVPHNTIEPKESVRETATQSAIAALLGFALQTQDDATPPSDLAPPSSGSLSPSGEDDSDSEHTMNSNDVEFVDTSVLGPEAKELAEVWVASKIDNTKKADWDYIESHTTGNLQQIIKEKRVKFADTFVENSLFHLRQYIPMGNVKAAFLEYRNGIAKRRFGASYTDRSRRKKKTEPDTTANDDANSLSQKAPGRRRRYGEISLVVNESEYDKPLEEPIMIDCHLTQELIELTRLLVTYNIVPAGRGVKIKLEHLERAGASEGLIMLCTSKRTSKFSETITLTNLISSKYVRDGFEAFLAEAARSYTNGGPIFGPSFCTRDIDEGKLSIPIALGLKEEHKELSRLLLIGNKGGVKKTKSRSFEWKLVDWDVVVKNASSALANKISARRKNKSFTNHAINNLVNNNAEQKAIIVYIERLRRSQLGILPSDSVQPDEPNEVSANPQTIEVTMTKSTDASEMESLSTEDDQSHKPLKKRKCFDPTQGLKTAFVPTAHISVVPSDYGDEQFANLAEPTHVETCPSTSEAVKQELLHDVSVVPVHHHLSDKPNEEDAQMLLDVGGKLTDLRSLNVKRPIMEISYKDRMTDDGCYRPSRDPQKKGDGTFARPRGRGPPGMRWDSMRGLFIPDKTKRKVTKSTNLENPLYSTALMHELAGVQGSGRTTSADFDEEDTDEAMDDREEEQGPSDVQYLSKKRNGDGFEVFPESAAIISSSKSPNAELIDQTIVSKKLGTHVKGAGDESFASRTDTPLEAAGHTEGSIPSVSVYGGDASQGFVWITAYCSILCQYDQGAHRRRQNFSRWYEVEWKIFLGHNSDGNREVFVDEQKARLVAFSNQELLFLEHLKAESMKIFSCKNLASPKLKTLSVFLSKLVEQYINSKIVEFGIVAGVMGKSLNAYMYLMEDRELKWDDFHDLQEAKLAKHEQSLSWNEHLMGCHDVISRLFGQQ